MHPARPALTQRRFAPFLVLFGFLLACGLLEGAVRVMGLAPPTGAPASFWQQDDRFGWYHIPGAEGYYFDPAGEYHAFARVNSAGLMGPETGESRPDGVFRILVLGDSFVEGLRLPEGAVFHAVLGQEVQARWGRRVEVINGGVAGWGTDQQLLFYREIGRRYQPDLVLLAFFPANDVMNNSVALESENFGGIRKPYFLLDDGALVLRNYPLGSEAAEPGAAQPAPALATQRPPLAFSLPLLERSGLYRYLIPRLRLAAPGLARGLAAIGLIHPGSETSDAAQGPDYIPVAYGVYRQDVEPAWESGWQVTAALLAQLRQEVEDDGAEFAVVVLPAQEQVESQIWQRILRTYPAMQAHGWDLALPNHRLQAILEAQHTPHLDLLPTFGAQSQTTSGLSGRPRLFFAIDGHWNEHGHVLAAEALADWLALNAALLAAGMGSDGLD